MKRYKVIFICLILFFLATACQKRQTANLPKPSIQTKAKAEELERQETESLLQGLKQKNPFRPDHAVGSFTATDQTENVLKGIIWDGQRPLAIIADTVVAVGDYVENKKVIRIDKDAVFLDNQGKEEILKLEAPLPEPEREGAP
jgi:type II secretory pathway component PulC